MDESFTFWFPSTWTLIGCLFTIFSFAFTVYVTYGRPNLALPPLNQIVHFYEKMCNQTACLREVQRDFGALRTAVAPPGEPLAQALRTLPELTTDLQALASIARETCEAVTRLTIDSQAPATPVLLEILTELRKMTKGGPKIQRRLSPFSLHRFLEAQAEGLARERMQATPNPFLDLD